MIQGRRRKHRRLQARLLLWFLGAILVAVSASVALTWLTTTDNSDVPTRVVSRHVQNRLARVWDDPKATDAYVQQLRDNTGLDFTLRREPPKLSPRNRNGKPDAMVFEDGVALFPIVKGGNVVGALELRTDRPGAAPGWRIAVGLGAAVLFLGAAARRVSMHLAKPLEHLAHTAERFGAGDLTARTNIEKLPRRWVAEEVRDTARAFDGMADRIGKVVTEQRELLAAISHELRSPLGRARVALEIARERSDEANEKVLAGADQQLVEVDAILGDLLASARAGLADLRREKLVLKDWLETRIATESTGPITLQGDLSGSIDADGALLGRALHNLLANAWAHGHPKETPLVVTVTREKAEPTMVRIAVRDRGPGFAEDLLPRVFDPFVQGGSAARSPGQQGLGLGLALVRRIVEAHAGHVIARNIEGGAEVSLEIPADLPPR